MNAKSQAGFSLVGLAATCTIMLILMGAAVPSWQYVMKDMREEELIFRGCQIKEAVERYQPKNGNTSPPSLEVLVKGKYLRQAYKDPMTKDGKWRLIRQGEMLPMAGTPGATGQSPSPSPGQSPSFGSRPSPSPSPSASPSTSAFDSSSGSSASGGGLGPIVGVATTYKDKSLRIFNGRTRYDEWLFIAGQPCVVGLHPGVTAPGPAPGQSPGASPSPRASPSPGNLPK